MNDTADTGTALALFPKLNLPSVTGITEEMSKSFGTMYTRIEEEIAALPTDMSIKANREKVASTAYKISRTKTGLDEAAADVASDAKQIVDAVNTERRQLKNTLDGLRDKARAPLDAWEEAEAQRKDVVKALSSYLANIEIMIVGKSSAELELMWEEVDATYIAEDMHGEDAAMLSELLASALVTITHEVDNAKRREAEAAELEQLRREKAEREAAEAARIAEEERKEREAAEAKRQEEERARITQEAAEKAERDAAEAIENAKREQAAAEQRAKEAEEREAKRIEDEKRREADAIEAQKEAAARAEEDAKRREEKAKEDERQRLAKIAAEKERADQERAADIAHRKKINSEAVAALVKLLEVNETFAQQIVIAIYKEQVPHITINY